MNSLVSVYVSCSRTRSIWLENSAVMEVWLSALVNSAVKFHGEWMKCQSGLDVDGFTFD